MRSAADDRSSSLSKKLNAALSRSRLGRPASVLAFLERSRQRKAAVGCQVQSSFSSLRTLRQIAFAFVNPNVAIRWLVAAHGDQLDYQRGLQRRFRARWRKVNKGGGMTGPGALGTVPSAAARSQKATRYACLAPLSPSRDRSEFQAAQCWVRHNAVPPL